MPASPSPESSPSPPAPSPHASRYAWLVLALWLLAILAICVRVGINPQRQSVYTADYAPAGEHWLHGENIYSSRKHFVYSPLTAAALVPFAVLPARAGNIVWRLFCAGALVAVAAAWLRAGLSGLGDLPPPAPGSPVTTTAFLLLLPLAAGNFNDGQMNVAVLAGVTAALLAARRQRWTLAAILFAAAGYLKIYPLAIGLLLAGLYPRQLAWRLVLAVAGLFGLSLVLQRPVYAWQEYQHWFATLGNDDRLNIDLSASWRDFAYLLRSAGLPIPEFAYRIMEAAAGAAAAVFLWWGQRFRGWSDARLFGGVLGLGCAWMVLFGPATEGATYVLLSLPVCASLVANWTLMPPRDSRGLLGLPGVFGLAYLLLLCADVANAWLRAGTFSFPLRSLQPFGGLVFTIGMIASLLRRPSANFAAASFGLQNQGRAGSPSRS